MAYMIKGELQKEYVALITKLDNPENYGSPYLKEVIKSKEYQADSLRLKILQQQMSVERNKLSTNAPVTQVANQVEEVNQEKAVKKMIITFKAKYKNAVADYRMKKSELKVLIHKKINMRIGLQKLKALQKEIKNGRTFPKEYIEEWQQKIDKF